VGVAEQNMMGLATGLALEGFIPFTYSIVSFATLRPYEFIRNGPLLHQLPVRIIGVGGGFEYGSAGPTHHGLEDVGVMRLQPGMVVIAPADAQQAGEAIRATWDMPQPIYYRLGKDEKRVIPGLDGRFEPGKLHVLQEGQQVVVFALGAITYNVLQAVMALKDQGLHPTLACVSSVVPTPREQMIDLLRQHSQVVTIEAHYTIGGLGSLVAEIMAENSITAQLHRVGIQSMSVDGRAGSQEYLEAKHGLDVASLVKTLADLW
jgi:transketolase